MSGHVNSESVLDEAFEKEMAACNFENKIVGGCSPGTSHVQISLQSH